jgi:hypothetical protein
MLRSVCMAMVNDACWTKQCRYLKEALAALLFGW